MEEETNRVFGSMTRRRIQFGHDTESNAHRSMDTRIQYKTQIISNILY